MITPAYSPTATERVLPRMALDITTGVLDSRVTVTRALDTATRVNSSGYIETVNANLPRFDYDPVTLAPKGLLIEETRANILLFSDQFNNVAWSTARGTITANSILAPNGLVAADKFTEDSTTNTRGTNQSVTITAAATHTASVYLKNIDRRYVSLIVANTTTGLNAYLATFDLQTGTSTTQIRGLGTVASASMVDGGNGYYRCSVTGTIPDTGAIIIVSPATTATPLMSTYGRESYLGDGVKAFYFWGADLEAGAFPTSYIPTTTTSLTRNADVVSMTGTNFSSWYNATSGAILARARQSVITGTRPSIYMSNGTANNIISLRGLAANPELYIKATTDQAQIDAGTLTANSSFGLVGAWTTDNCAAAINGGAAVTDTSATITTVDQMLIGSDGTNYLNGQVERISYWPQRIINAEAQAFSK
jgi:hypothetical protein